jgi:uncharacterized protein YceH (UPF0502 family)
VRLGLEEGRVIGCLIEKQLTTPQQYPLTLNALVSACNQSSNRDPVVSYDESVVEQAVARLRDAQVVRLVHPSHGRSVIRYAQVLDERLGLDERRLALVAVLLLRGPQTAGELRARTERMATFDGIAAVDADLHHMSGGPEPLVLRLPRRPGQKEERWTQLLVAGPLDSAGTVGGGTGIDPVPPLPFPGAAARAGPALGTGLRSETAPASDDVGDGRRPPPTPCDTSTRAPLGPDDAVRSARLADALESIGERLTVLVDEVVTLRAEVSALGAAIEQREPKRQRVGYEPGTSP